MTRTEKNANLAEVKLALARKHENLARISGSVPKRNTMLHHAAKFRREAAELLRR